MRQTSAYQSGDTQTADKVDVWRARAYLIFSIIGITALVVGACWLLGKIWLALYTLAVTAFIVFIFHRLVDRLEVRHVPRVCGIIISYLILFGVLTILGFLIGPALGKQVSQFFGALPQYIDECIAWAQGIWAQYGHVLENADVQSILSGIGNSANDWVAKAAETVGNAALQWVASIGRTLLVLFMSLVAAFWFLLDYHRIAHEFTVIIGPKHIDNANDVMRICGHVFGGYCKGILLASCCTGTLAGIGFALIGEPYPAMLGLLTGLMNIIPVIGPWIAGIVAALIGLSVGPWVCVLSIIITIIAQQFTDTFITPGIMSATVSLHPGLVVLALAAGATVGGVVGMILAVPLFAVIKAIYVFYFEKRTGRELAEADGAFFRREPKPGEAGWGKRWRRRSCRDCSTPKAEARDDGSDSITADVDGSSDDIDNGTAADADLLKAADATARHDESAGSAKK